MAEAIHIPEGVIVRPYRKSDREDVRQFAANDEHERPELLKKFPRLGEYRADGLAHFYALKPESMFVAEHKGEFIGNLLGTVDAELADHREEIYTRRLRRRRLLFGAYGVPIWLIPLVRTEPSKSRTTIQRPYYIAALIPRLEPPSFKKLFGFDDEAYEYKDVTALEYGKRFHNRSFVNEHAVQLLESIK